MRTPFHAGTQPTGMYYASWRLADFPGRIPGNGRTSLPVVTWREKRG
jgi:hypothetical protein